MPGMPIAAFFNPCGPSTPPTPLFKPPCPRFQFGEAGRNGRSQKPRANSIANFTADNNARGFGDASCGFLDVQLSRNAMVAGTIVADVDSCRASVHVYDVRVPSRP